MSLPAGIKSIVDVIGHTKAMLLVGVFGGGWIVFPRQPGSDTWRELADLIGEADTQRLGVAFGGANNRMYIAKCAAALRAERNKAIIGRYDELLGLGNSGNKAVAAMVKEFYLSYRQLENIINAPVPESNDLDKQAELF